MDFAETARSVLNVLLIGLLFGAGLPALFSFGIKAVDTGDGHIDEATGAVTTPQPAMKAVGYGLYAVIVAAIAFGILWITKGTLLHHFGWHVFPASWY